MQLHNTLQCEVVHLTPKGFSFRGKTFESALAIINSFKAAVRLAANDGRAHLHMHAHTKHKLTCRPTPLTSLISFQWKDKNWQKKHNAAMRDKRAQKEAASAAVALEQQAMRNLEAAKAQQQMMQQQLQQYGYAQLQEQQQQQQAYAAVPPPMQQYAQVPAPLQQQYAQVPAPLQQQYEQPPPQQQQQQQQQQQYEQPPMPPQEQQQQQQYVQPAQPPLPPSSAPSMSSSSPVSMFDRRKRSRFGAKESVAAAAELDDEGMDVGDD
jgi:hypothetical protein